MPPGTLPDGREAFLSDLASSRLACHAVLTAVVGASAVYVRGMCVRSSDGELGNSAFGSHSSFYLPEGFRQCFEPSRCR